MTADQVLQEIVTRIDEARSANEYTRSPWPHKSVLELLAHLREPFSEGGATAGGDEHHTLEELYEYRMLYNALAANEWARHGTYPVVKSWRHSDGEECFGGGWFIVVATLPTGQVSNHYAAEHWDLFAVPEVETPPEYDGHDPAEAARRMRALLSQPTPSAEPTVLVPVSLVEQAPHDRKCASFLWNGVGWDHDDTACDCWKARALSQPRPPAAPPSIADMAPGTTFTAQMYGGNTYQWVTTSGSRLWMVGKPNWCVANDLDPSTIRDVIPPPTTPEAEQ